MQSSVPSPRYSIWQGLAAALALGRRAIEEVRALPAARDGKDGRCITAGAVEDGNLVIALSDGESLRLGQVVGPKGDKGEKGESIVGPQGPQGPPGSSVKGDRGDRGPAGLAGKSIVGPPGRDAAGGTVVSLGESRPANIDSHDLGRLRLRELVIDGESVGHLIAWD